MTPQELIDHARVVLDDNGEPQLWTDDELVRYLNAAVNEACERALLIEDRSTPACCTITLVAGQAEYPLHKSVIRVKRVAWGSDVLTSTSTEELDDGMFGWENAEGRPAAFIEGSGNTIRLSRIPRAEDLAVTPTLSLVVYRTLLSPLTPESNLDGELTDVKAIYQLRLLDWVGRLAYMKRDSETFDATRSNQFEADFIRSFGERPDANVQRKRRDRRPPVVRMRF
jgi:hypothetical protein